MDKPCFVVTDLPPTQATQLTYHLRFWIEAGFKDMKRWGLRWEQMKIVDPLRMERLWLGMRVALVFLIAQGALPDELVTPDTYMRLKPRRLSCFWRGWLCLFN